MTARSQSISGVIAVNPLTASYEIHEGKKRGTILKNSTGPEYHTGQIADWTG
jgi:hypothetical protein